MAAIKALPHTDPESFFQQAAIHGGCGAGRRLPPDQHARYLRPAGLCACCWSPLAGACAHLNVCTLPAPLLPGFPFVPYRGAVNPTDPFDPSKWDRSDPMARWGGECRASCS